MCINLATGEVSFVVTDVALPGPPPLTMSRTYSSVARDCSSLGYAWSHDLGASLMLNDEGIALEWSSGENDLFPSLGPGDTASQIGTGRVSAALRRVADGFVVSKESGERLSFRPASRTAGRWLVHSIVDRYGNSQMYAYDERDLLTSVTDSRSRVLLVRYSRTGLIEQIALQSGNVRDLILASFRYDHDQNLIASRDATGATQRYEYQDHLLVAHHNRLGGKVYFAYDDSRRCIRTWQADGRATRYFDFHSTERMTLSTDPLGWRTLYQFNEKDLLVTRLDPLGNRFETSYDPHGNVLFSDDDEVTDGSLLLYDVDANKLQTIAPDGAVSVQEFDEGGRLVEHRDALGNVTRWERDPDGNPAVLVSPLGARTTTRYDARGYPVAILDPNGRETRITRSDDLREVRYHDQLGEIGRFRFDDLGRVEHVTAPGGDVLRVEYDLAGRETRTVGATGDVVHTTYDAQGNPIQFTDPLGRQSSAKYDAYGNLIAITDRAGRRVTLSYDAAGRLVSSVNENGEEITFWHDPVGRVERVTFFDGSNQLFEYGPWETVRSTTFADGRRIAYEHDDGHRLTTKRYPDGSETTFGYDAMGRLVEASNEHSRVSFAYDEDGRLTRDTQDDLTVEYQYDQAGYLVRRICGRRVTAYERDVRGRVVRIIDDAGGTYEFRYENGGSRLVISGPDGFHVTLGYDAAGRLLHQKARVGSRKSITRQWEYDVAGRLVRLIDTSAKIDAVFSYDAVDQIVDVSIDGKRLLRYDYDPCGNLVSSHALDAVRYGPGGHVAEINGQAVRTDARGNVVQRPSAAADLVYEFGFENELLGVSDHSGQVASFRYDPLLRRIAKVAAGIETRFVWSADSIISETRSDGQQTDYVQGLAPHSLLAQVVGTTPYHCLSDHVDAPVELLARDGTSVWRRPLPYDSPSTLETVRCPWRFPGQYQDDETGLAYNRFRYYDPALCRYLSSDPLPFLDDLNVFRYAHNSFPNRVDPLGLASCFRPECDALFKNMDNRMNTGQEGFAPHPGAAGAPHGKGLKRRWAEQIRSRRQQPVRRLPGDPLGQRQTGQSHINMYRQIQTGLQRELQEWDDLGCQPKNTSDPTRAGRVQQDARNMAVQEPPIKHRGDAQQKFGKA